MEGVRDRDGDGFDAAEFCDGTYTWGGADPDAPACDGGGDCDDYDLDVYPGAEERCGNEVDDDCDGAVDDFGLGEVAWFLDDDGDGFGDPSEQVIACGPPEGYVGDDNDCDDGDDDSHPGADEVCDGADNDCDTVSDEGAVDAPTWYFDDDGDGYGLDDVTQVACDQPQGFVALGGDCDDELATVNPGAQEVCSGRDDDCDTLVDQDDPSMSGVANWYYDGDGDGWGIAGDTVEACSQPQDYAAQPGDCADGNPDVNPGEDEVCNAGVDDDCNTLADDDPGVEPSSYTTWYVDGDGDDFGPDSSAVDACEAPADHVPDGGDCNDANPDVNPDATEICNDIDDDCDTLVDAADNTLDPNSRFSWYFDHDGDDYGVTATLTLGCDRPSPDWVADPGDCDDDNSAVNPGATEVCNNGDDDDCDGTPNQCVLSGTLDVTTIAVATLVNSGNGFGGRHTAGDVDNDGTTDLLVGGYGGSAYVFRGPLSGTINASSAYATFTSTSWALHGASIEGDYNGDGRHDIALGRSENEEVLVYWGPAAGLHTVGATAVADVVIAAPDQKRFGWFLTAMPDQNGDGRDELVAGAPLLTDIDNVESDLFVFAQLYPNMGDADALAWLYSPDFEDGTGQTAVVRDMNDDQVLDLVVPSHGGEDWPGSVGIVWGPVTTDVNVKAGTRLVEPSFGGNAGWRTAACDLIDDDAIDLAVSAIRADDYLGRVYVVAGPFGASVRSLDTAEIVISPASAHGDNIQFGIELGCGDFNGDWRDDLFVMSNYEDNVGNEIGALFGYFGPLDELAGTLTDEDADFVIHGPPGEPVGSGLLVADLNLDGIDDLIAGQGGRVYIVLGLGL